MKLAISLATRNRAPQLLQTINAVVSCLSLDNTVLMIQVDADDPVTIQALTFTPLDRRIKVNIAPREDTIAAKWNRVLCEPADVYLVAADDDPVITPQADVKILEAAKLLPPDGVGIVYGHLVNSSFASIVGVTAQMAEMMGYLQPELFPYWFCDHWTDDIARMIGRLVFADVKTDQSKAAKTMEMREPGWWATWFDASFSMREDAARRIIESPHFDLPDWANYRDRLLRNFPLIRYRSRWINQAVRNTSANLESWSGLSNKDDRYQRVKQRAIDMLPQLLAAMPPEEAKVYAQALNPPAQIVNLPRLYA